MTGSVCRWRSRHMTTLINSLQPPIGPVADKQFGLETMCVGGGIDEV